MFGPMQTAARLFAGTALAVAMACPAPSLAQEYSTTDSVVTVELLDGWRDVDGTHFAGIEITLAPGWKTYWRAPGDGGLPTSLNWSRSSNLQTAKVHWPRPDVFRVAGLRSIG